MEFKVISKTFIGISMDFKGIQGVHSGISIYIHQVDQGCQGMSRDFK